MTPVSNPRTRFSFISDPSHGWLMVTPAKLHAVGITEDDITPYSYRNVSGQLIALEEDCDAHTFLRKWEAMIGKRAEIEDTVEGWKFIRSWPSFGKKTSTAVGQGGTMTTADQVNHSEIARQNDEFRRSYGRSLRVSGRIMMTPGVADFDALIMMKIQVAIILFNNFTKDNDPYREHDFGAFSVDANGEDTKIWFKIDLYDPSYNAGSEKPDDTTQTRRVMTIMLPSEYWPAHPTRPRRCASA